MDINYYFNEAHPLRPYTFTAPANPGSIPPINALRVAPPAFKTYWWPCEQNGAWTEIEDYRERTVQYGFPEGAEQTAVEFWLPGDTWQTRARTMEDVGPLPEGAFFTAPKRTEEEVLIERIAEIDSEFAELEQAAIRPTMSITLALTQGVPPAPEDVAKIAEIDAQKTTLREERAVLQARLDELQA